MFPIKEVPLVTAIFEIKNTIDSGENCGKLALIVLAKSKDIQTQLF